MKESVLRYLLSELNRSMSYLRDFSSNNYNLDFYWHYSNIEFIIGFLNRCDIVVFYDDVSLSWKVVE